MKTKIKRPKRQRKVALVPKPKPSLKPVPEPKPQAGKWIMDKAHSSIEFSLMHFNVVNIGGRFNSFDLNIFSTTDDLSDAIVELVIHTASIDTGNALRDTTLKGEDWLDVERFPAINFNSTSFKKVEEKKYEITGNISIHGISHTITLEATLNGEYTDNYPERTIAGFTVRGLLDREKFGFGGLPAATGVSNAIDIAANLEIVKS